MRRIRWTSDQFKDGILATPHSHSRHPALVACAAFSLLVLCSLPCFANDSAEVLSSASTPVLFEREVMSVLSKGGCNAGTCHGNVNGKGGFFLSLRGQDPVFDYQQLVRAADGRRVNQMSPKDSLLLLKATAKIAHQGGKRFDEQSPEYQILQRWVQDGLSKPDPATARVIRLSATPEDLVLWKPDNELQLRVTAHFEDGTQRDVTRLAVYEPSDPRVSVNADGKVQFEDAGLVTILVRYLDGQFPVRIAYRSDPMDFRWTEPASTNFIDDIVFERLRGLRVNPAPLAEDNIFLRRVFLDLLGKLPSADQAREFVADPSPTKRLRLIDELLERPEFAEMWALKWSDVIRNEEKTLDATGVEKLHKWMQEWFVADRPINEFARELIAARGSTYDNPPANFWRAHREPFVRAETTAQVFLGVRLQCAKCHNHPFDRWSQDEYYQWSSLFAGVDYEIVENNRRDRLDKHEFVGDQIVTVKQGEKVNNARTGKPAEPKFLGSSSAIDADRLKHLSDWMAAPDNRMFARAQANRIWYHLMGAGLVDPVDDLRLTNPASHPELLERLTDELVANNFSLKHLVRTIVRSRTYQLGSDLSVTEIHPTEYDERLFARAVMRRLTAEQILDAQSHVLGIPANFEGYPTGTRAGQIAGVQRVRRSFADGDLFLRQFGKPERLLACECERSDQPTLGQALSLVGGESLHNRLSNANNRLGQLLNENRSTADVIDELVWTALTRPPTQQERDATMELIAQTGNARAVLEDLTWALLNAKELIFRN